MLSVAARALAEEHALTADPRKLRPGELVRLLNSTPLGTVCDAKTLARHRAAAGFRIGDKSIDLLRYAGWLAERRHASAAPVADAGPGQDRRRVVATIQDVADVFGVERNTVKDWRKQRMPGSPGAFELGAIARWLRERPGAQPVVAANGENLQEKERRTKIRTMELEVAKREREAARESGALIPRAAIESQLAQVLIELRKTFERLPQRLQSVVPAAAQHAVTAEAKRLVHVALHEAADALQAVGRDALPPESSP